MELSRCQHFIVLGQAYILTRDKKYSDELINQVHDWISHNPVGYGVNWICAMEVAIRVVNWLVAMEFIKDCDSLSREFLEEFYASVHEHGTFIRDHLEFASGLTTNHYLADIAGLFFIAVYCSFFEESKEWQEFAFKELHKEIDNQVYPDGCNFESSTSYHRLVLEMFFYAELLGKRAGIDFFDDYTEKIRKMFEVSLYCIKPNGKIPQIGDNDSGRFLKFSNRHILNHKYLLSLAAVSLNNGLFKEQNCELDSEAFWVFGENAKITWDNLSVRETLSGAKSFPDAGWYIIRHESDYCIVSCGPNGGDGWHSHNDKLSFELIVDGQDIIVDPGTYVYTSFPKERNKFRSTEYHNTIKFNEHEQNPVNEEMIFFLPDKVTIVKAELNETENKIVFQGIIQYAGISHERIITIDKDSSKWKITDSFSSSNHIDARMLFHLSPHLTSEGNNILKKETREKIATLEVESYSLKKSKYEYSPEYGVKIKGECLVVNIPAINDITSVTTHIYSIK
jgi:hypothetical protein